MTTKDIDSLKGIIDRIHKAEKELGEAAIVLKDKIKAEQQAKEDSGHSRAIISNVTEPTTVVKKVIEKGLKEFSEIMAPVVQIMDEAIISETKTGNKRAIIGHDPSDIPAINKTIDEAILKENREAEMKEARKKEAKRAALQAELDNMK